MVRAVSLAGCFQPGAPLSLAAEKQLLLRHCLFDGNKYKPFGAVCQRVVSRGKGKISRVKQKETSKRMSLFAGAEGGIWTLAPLLTAYSLSRGAPSATWVLLQAEFHTYMDARPARCIIVAYSAADVNLFFRLTAGGKCAISVPEQRRYDCFLLGTL